MKLEEEIQYLYDNHPHFFQTRKDCLNHLFCVVGHGYQWVNGQLVSIGNCKINVDTGEIMSINEPKIELKGDNKAKQTILYDRKYYKHFSDQWHPVCEYSAIKTHSDDIQEDWQRGITETITMILQGKESQ